MARGVRQRMVASAVNLLARRGLQATSFSEVLKRGKFEAGCAVLAVAVAADSPELLDQTARVFRTWRRRLAELLEQGGLAVVDAQRFAAVLVASSEGAVVMARAEQSLEGRAARRSGWRAQPRACP